MKRFVLTSVALGFAALSLSACGKKAPDQATASPDSLPGISVTDGRLVLPAVKGNPGAVYFNITYNGDDVAMLRAADVKGAKSAMLHDTVKSGDMMSMSDLPPVKLDKGVTVKFEPGGKHVMAMNLDDSLKPGGTTDVTLTFTGGDKTTFPVKIFAAGDTH